MKQGAKTTLRPVPGQFLKQSESGCRLPNLQHQALWRCCEGCGSPERSTSRLVRPGRSRSAPTEGSGTRHRSLMCQEFRVQAVRVRPLAMRRAAVRFRPLAVRRAAARFRPLAVRWAVVRPRPRALRWEVAHICPLASRASLAPPRLMNCQMSQPSMLVLRIVQPISESAPRAARSYPPNANANRAGLSSPASQNVSMAPDSPSVLSPFDSLELLF